MSERECGRVICQDSRGNYSAGRKVCGNRSNVSVPVSCPANSRPVALDHNHPSGNQHCSPQDIKAAKMHNIPIICVKVDGSRGTKCYRLKKG